jgi:tetratricopeptide (TPR) repeat protein
MANLGRGAEAETGFAESLALRRQLVEKWPAVPDFRLRLGRVLWVRGQLRATTGRPGEAGADFHEALALLTRLVEEHPEVYEHGSEMVEVVTHLAALPPAGDQARQETERLLRGAVQACEKLERPAPGKEAVPVFSAQVRYALGQFLESAGDAAAAAEVLGAALAEQKQVVAKAPSVDASGVLIAILCRMGRHAEAAAAAEDMARGFPDNGLGLYNAACALSQCKALAAKGSQPTGAKREELRQTYADRAMHLLRQAVQHGFKAAAQIDSDSDLDPVRGRADFEELLESLGVPRRELLPSPSEMPQGAPAAPKPR